MKRFLMILLTVLILTGCGTAEPPAAEESPAPVGTSAAETAEAEDAKPNPVYPETIAEGSYEISVDSSSSMFRVVKCVLTVKDGVMTAKMTMSGQGYGLVYMGTGEEAVLDAEENYIPFELDTEGAKVFTVPVEALDKEIDCAAWSIKKESWYDRVLVFESAMMPEGTITVD